MIAFAAVLTVLALQAPAADCEVTDNACKAQQFIARARTAKPQQRALLLFTAHRSYLAHFARTGKLRDLCAARTSFERSLAVPGQDEGQRANFEAERAELDALEKQHGARCGKPSKHRSSEPAVAAAAATQATSPIAEPPPEPAPPTPTTRAAEGLLAVSPAEPEHPPTSDPSLPLPAPAKARPPGRGLLIAGGTTLGVSVVVLGVAAFAGSQVANLSYASRQLYKNEQGEGDAESLIVEERLRSDLDRWVPVTVGTAIAGGTALIVGAVLVHVGLRRARGTPLRTSLVPVPGGLAIHARF